MPVESLALHTVSTISLLVHSAALGHTELEAAPAAGH